MERRPRLLTGARAAGVLLALLASAGLADACAGVVPGTSGGTLAAEGQLFMGERADELRYSHARHLREDVGCLDCHPGVDEGAPRSTALATHARCVRCHDTADRGRCGACHLRPDQARKPVREASGIFFGHREHLPRVEGDCMRCHAEVAAAKALGAIRPGMETCTGDCHRPALAETRCELCHADLSRYRLESIRFMAHGANYERRHGPAARAAADACARCHERTFCSDCHASTAPLPAEVRHAERATRSYIHPAPYEAIHAIDARAQRDTCASCHRPSFCRACHATVGLSSLSSERPAPHPSGWLDPMSPSFHGLEARRAIATCAGCHDRGAASNCVRCHQVGGTGGNPHPPGFARGRDARRDRMCRICHVPGGT